MRLHTPECAIEMTGEGYALDISYAIALDIT